MFSGVFLVPYYTIPKIKRELKHVYVYFRIFSQYTTLYAAYAKPISTFEELQNVNLAPYENYVLTNDIIEGDARARGRDMYAVGRGARGARIYSVSGKEKSGKTRVESMRKNESGEHAGNRSGEYAVARESKRNDWTESCESAGGEMVET